MLYKIELYITLHKQSIKMELGKRYLFVGTDNKTYTGDVIRVTETMVIIENRSCEFYKNSGGLFSTARSLIKWTFPLDDLIEGQRYKFTIHTDDNTSEGTFMNISGRHDTVHLKIEDGGINSFTLYCVKNICMC
jgi:hypothetical protein